MLARLNAKLAFCSLITLALLAANATLAKDRADCEREYRPKFGQRGKDVPWEPTSGPFATAMLSLANTTATDRVYDLGAGDGTIVIAAAKQFGASATGIEYNRDLAKLGQCYIEVEGLAGKAKMIAGDIFETNFSDASVVTMFLWPEVNLRLRPTLLKMPAGTRVVSHMHTMESWKWDDEVALDSRRAYLWIVPAQVEGTWTFQEVGGQESFTLALKQQFQRLTGKLQRDGSRTDVAGSMRGTAINLDLGQQRKLSGVLEGDRITATLSSGLGDRRYIGTESSPARRR